MPHEWIDGRGQGRADSATARAGASPRWRLRAWAHRSLPRETFVAFLGATGLLNMVPLLTVLGTPVFWALLPFQLLAFGLLWGLLKLSYRTRTMEELCLWSDRVELVRCDPPRPRRSWTANPYWVRVGMHPVGGPVADYVTLTGNGRTVEIGAFLTPEERRRLHEELEAVLTGRR